MARLQLLQLDSVPVVIRTQYLPLYSRLGAYDPALLDRIAYRDGEWFEAWAHEASLVPVDLEPELRWMKDRARRGDIWAGLARLARNEARYVDSVYDEVRDRGPITASELSDPRPRKGEWWDGRSVGRQALEWLFRTGRVGIRRVGNFEKEWDLLERVVPPEVLARPTPSEPDAQRALLARAAGALGVGTATDLVDYFRMPITEGRERLDEMTEDGELARCSVEGWKHTAFRAPGSPLPRSVPARALLSPFDPLVWFRDRARRLFDFEYRIEIYVPKARRRYGYYVLPFLLDDQIVARADLKTDRDAGVLRVLAVYAEDGVDRDVVAGELSAELDELATVVGADEVSVGRRGDLAGALASVRRG